jgi:hypothetical protein
MKELELPKGYTVIEQPHFKGPGNHSVRELEELCKTFTEYCHQQQIIKQQLVNKLKNNTKWKTQ